MKSFPAVSNWAGLGRVLGIGGALGEVHSSSDDSRLTSWSENFLMGASTLSFSSYGWEEPNNHIPRCVSLMSLTGTFLGSVCLCVYM